MAGPLEGIRAVEWAVFGNGPIIGVLLGYMGADVIKIEHPVYGDPTRGTKSLYGTAMDTTQGRNLLFESANLNKRSMAVDLAKDEGRNIAYKLIKTADVFHTNYFERSARKAGLDYEALSSCNPRLIYAQATGYGSKGPDKDKRAFDPAVLGRSGMMLSAGERGTPPVQVVGAICDTQGAIMSAFGILAALFAREKTGRGQKIEAPMLAAMTWLQYTNVFIGLVRGQEMARYSRNSNKNPLTNFYRCKDDKWLMFAEVQSDRYWHEFCEAIGIEECENDLRFADSMKRRDSAKELISILDRVIASKTRDEWIEILNSKKVGFAYEIINSVADLRNDRQVLENEFIINYNHPILGEVQLPGFPVKFGDTPADTVKPGPELGQHTEEIMLELGYSWDDISRLRDQAVI